MIDLSIILISRNQAWNVVRLIESVLKETANIKSKEIILVDSASTDKTLELACACPIKLIRLHDNQHLTPAAGRYVGCKHTKGELILFLDGDNELYPGWLEKGFQVLQNSPDVAVVTGPRLPLPMSAKEADKPPLVDIPINEAFEPRHTGGSAMFRRSVLNKVGTFNPYLYSDEEPDLSLRIRRAGHRIIKLHHPIAYDYSDPAGVLSTKIARWRRNLYLGFGQNLRYNLGKGIFWQYLKERGFGVLPAIGMLCGLAAMLWYLASGEYVPITLCVLVGAIFVIVDAIKKRSIYKTLVGLLERFFIVDGTIRGFFLKPLPPKGYCAQFDQIK